ncbi:hypothetical protein ACTFIU_008663 [Dictyostelium citrinum]
MNNPKKSNKETNLDVSIKQVSFKKDNKQSQIWPNGKIRTLVKKTKSYRMKAPQYPFFSELINQHQNENMLEPFPPQSPQSSPPSPLIPLLQNNPHTLETLLTNKDQDLLELPSLHITPQIDEEVERFECNIKCKLNNLREEISKIGNLTSSLNQTNHFLEPFLKIKYAPKNSRAVITSLEPYVNLANDYLIFFQSNRPFINEATANSAIIELKLISTEFADLSHHLRSRLG